MLNKKTKIGLGMVIGGVAGVLAGLFASKNPGKKLRSDVKNSYDKIVKTLSDKNLDKKVKKIFGENSQEFKSSLMSAKGELAEKLYQLQKTSEKIDAKKYTPILSSIIKSVSNKQKLPSSTLANLKSYLKQDIEKFKKLVIVKSTKKTRRNLKKKA